MRQHDPIPPTWIKSSYSGDDGGNCLEVAPGFPDLVPVRDSKAPAGPTLVFERRAWNTFVGSL
ncbi:DUF397 domain-containing protein [Streptomyces sp. NPDC090127]|uniref:DUF397 domain-containing protein n=1 Tax=Streptomyces sp. NPDC090127 TaxID=3365953 RepID=UPI00382BFFEF